MTDQRDQPLLTLDLAVTHIVGRYGLTPRQADVLRLMLIGRNDAEICTALGIKYGTVRSHVEAIFERLEINGRGEIVRALFVDDRG